MIPIIFQCVSQPYLLELKVEIFIISGELKPDLESLIILLKQNSLQKKLIYCIDRVTQWTVKVLVRVM